MNCQPPFPGVQLSVLFIISFSIAHGYPSSLFQGSAYSGAVHRHRNKNWCAFIVQKNVSCAVQGSVESHVEPEAARCPEHQPDCEPQMIYRTRFRPTYKIAYKTVTELEWRCCPGYQGPDCRELKGSPNGQTAYPQSYPQPQHGQTRPAIRPERREIGQYDIRRTADKTRILEEEVQRLSQTVLDLQAAMTGMAENLRTDLQEDTSKMLITLLNDRTSPDSARTGGTEESVVHLDGQQAMRGHTHGEREMETLLARLNDMTDALKSKDEALEELRGTVTGHDRQIRMLMDSSSQALPVTGAAAPDIDTLQTYIDGKFEKLKKELVVNMEEEMAKLKNACDEKIQSLQKTCEDGKDSSYVSLTDLVHNKEAELRKEIRELRLDLSMSDGVVRTNRQTTIGKDDGDYDDLKRELIRVAEAHRVLNARVDNELDHLSSLKIEDVLSSQLEDLEDRMNVTERNAETYCFYVDEKLTKEIKDEVAMLRQLLDQKLNAVQDQFTSMLIKMSNNSFPEMSSDSVDALQIQVNANRYLIKGLEDKFNAIGQICSTDCKTNLPTDSQKPEGLDSLVKDVRLCRNDLDVLRSDFVNNIARLHALEDTVKMSPEKQFINVHIQDTRKRINALTDNVNGLTGTITGLGDTVSKFSQDLHTLNSSCCQQVSSSPLWVETGKPSHNQMKELKDQVDALNARVTTELSVCKFNTAGVVEDVSAVDDRVTALEKICGSLDGDRNNIQGLSGELESKVAQMNSTLGSHSGAITALQNSLLNFQSQLAGMAKQIHKDHASRDQGLPVRQERPASGPDTRAPTRPMRPYVPHIHIPLIIPHRTVPAPTGRPHVRQPHVPHQPYFPQPPGSPRHPIHPVPPHQPAVHQPVVVTGQAGPPGYVHRVTVRRDQSSDDSKTPLKGFAGAPGYPPVNPVSYNTKQSQPEAAHVPWNPAYQRTIATPVSQQNSLTDPFSFSAGLTRQMFSGDFGIIRFDRVLVNDGGHYNPQTGIFRVPADGRYLVSAVLTAPRGEHAEAVLSVSNRSVQKLDTAGYWSSHPRLTQDQCMCGGSASFSLILPLRQGDTVALVRTAGKLAISDSREILSTFSAIFLYSPQAKR
ncbi:EMILIN-2-like isoform X2 [Sinocyclocheilus rhinocerous]|uniref:EMILIN-2-like isoform X1 n=1 Tax=Sinocyclocheilus rhinocerous TaxID=307959 RepID=UPI0007B978B2|nr:PREDICTED: EMILIN-2-like isoform X1 [Sinocyclocheilus rhinocerous]XP_016416720.1 PREDICTED: EMILIN-2-like isoform X2 [Sinocyclocheilus rhinocerous]